MKLFGLKDKDDKEYVITLLERAYSGTAWELTDISPMTIEPESNFKVGDWVMLKENNDEENYYPKRIIAIGGMVKCINNIEDKESWSWYYKHIYRLATPQEIESHLRKICDEKYVGKSVRCIGFENEVHKIKEFSLYNNEYDLMYYYIYDNADTCCVYQGGKFAEIVADEFKELPKTVDELVLLLQDFDRDGGQLTPWGFLTERGYKTA